METSKPSVLKSGTITKRIVAQRMRQQPTKAEAVLWEQLRGNRLLGLKFRRQQPICGFIVDFYCHEIGVAIEVDGSVHENQRQYDEERDRILAAKNVIVIRYSNEAVLGDLLRTMSHIKKIISIRTDNEMT